MVTEKIAPQIANPAPLGLLGFGMTTILLNLHNAGIIPLTGVILAMGVMLGGLAQIVAGIMEFQKNNAFGATAFTAYGAFWLSLVVILTNPFGFSAIASDSNSMGYYLLLWGVFSFFMYIGTLKHNKTSQIVFLSLTVLLFLLSAADFTESHLIKMIAGWEGIFCGASALYNSVAQIVNNEHGKVLLPL